MRHDTMPQLDDSFDPRGSIFLPHTSQPDREFSRWETAIFLRRGELLGPDSTPEDQQRLYDELCRVRQWWLARTAERCIEIGG